MPDISEGSISLTQMRLSLTTRTTEPLKLDGFALMRRGRVTSPVPVVKPPATEQSNG